MQEYRVYILTKNGNFLRPEIIQLLLDNVRKYGEVVDIGMGSAYNDPLYLLGEIENNPDEVFVIAWDDTEADQMPRPRALVGEREVVALVHTLEDNMSEDAWEIAMAVNHVIRGN